MNLTLNRLSVLIAGLVLGGLLLMLSIFYFQEKRNAEIPKEKNSVAGPEKPIKARVKISKEEKEKIQLQREAERTGRTPEELMNAAKDPQSQIDREAQRIQGLTSDEARSELTRKKRQLEKIRTENVEQIMDVVSVGASGESKRETTVLKKVEADRFDADSAQIDDCRKSEAEDGTVRYFATLVDARGNSIEVEMKGKEGEQTYRTMRMIKNNPLMEMIYRGSVMPLMDRKLEQNEKDRRSGSGASQREEKVSDSAPEKNPAISSENTPGNAQMVETLKSQDKYEEENAGGSAETMEDRPE